MADSSPSYLGRNSVSPYPRGELVRRVLWSVVEATLFRWSPRPWHGFRVLLLQAFGAEVHEPGTVRIYPSARTVFPWKLTLHPHVMIGPGVRLYNLAHVTLHAGANLSQDCQLCAGTHDYQRWDMPLVAEPISIGRNAWLAAEVFVGPGVTVGELAVVGVRSLVLQDLPARMVCAGHPCVPIKPRPEPS